MADGAIFGKRNAYDQFAHTDTNPQTTAQLAIPTTPDAIYHIFARVTCHGSGGASGLCGQLTGKVVVDGAALAIAGVTWTGTDGGTGYTATLDVSGGNVRVRTTAANLQRSVAHIEAFGVEMNIVAS